MLIKIATSTTHRCLPPCVLQCCSHYHIKEKTNIQSKNLDNINKKFVFECLAVLIMSKNQFKPVWSSCAKNYPKRKLELLSPQNRYIGHQGGIWNITGTPYTFFVCWQFPLEFEVLLKHWKGLKLGVKSSFFKINITRNFFLEKYIYFF